MNKFSVLISVYHKENPQFLKIALDSIFNQTICPNEVVLVEDGPLTDSLYETINEYEENFNGILKVVRLPQNVGLGRALNAGLEQCSHDLVVRMDTDDICVENRFERLLQAVSENESADVIGSWIDEFATNPTEVVSVRQTPEKDEDIKQLATSRSPMNHVSVLFKKVAVQAVGGYQDFYLLEDYYLWCRMIKANCTFYNLQEVLVHVRCGTDMFRRRGGLKYAKSEYRLFKYMYKSGMIGLGRFLFNASARFIVRVSPTWLRQWVYLKLLR